MNCPFDSCKCARVGGGVMPYRGDGGTCTRPATFVSNEDGQVYPNPCPIIEAGKLGRKCSYSSKLVKGYVDENDKIVWHAPTTKPKRARARTVTTRAKKVQSKVAKQPFKRLNINGQGNEGEARPGGGAGDTVQEKGTEADSNPPATTDRPRPTN